MAAGELMNVKRRGETEYLSLVNEGAALFEKREYALAAARFWKAFQLRPSAPVLLSFSSTSGERWRN